MNAISEKDFMPVDQLRAMQLEKLQKLIPYEYERVPLFRRRCDEKGVKPRDLVTLKDLGARSIASTAPPAPRASPSAFRRPQATWRYGPRAFAAAWPCTA